MDSFGYRLINNFVQPLYNIHIIKGRKYSLHLIDDTTINYFTQYSDALVYCVKNKYYLIMMCPSTLKEYQI